MVLKDKLVILTGASEGIGKAIAEKLAAEGCDLALLARNEQKLRELKEHIGATYSRRAEIYACDITDQSKLEESIAHIAEDFSRNADILINNAGIWHKTMDVDQLDAETISAVIQTNLLAHIQLTRLALPQLRQAEQSAIINIISRSGAEIKDGQSVYSASKWGMRGFTEVLRKDLRNTSVKIGAVYQAGTNTDLFEKAGQEVDRDKFTDPNDLADVVICMLNRPEKIWLSEVHVEY